MNWSKSLLGFFHKLLHKNPNELFGQPNTSEMDHNNYHILKLIKIPHFPSVIHQNFFFKLGHGSYMLDTELEAEVKAIF